MSGILEGDKQEVSEIFPAVTVELFLKLARAMKLFYTEMEIKHFIQNKISLFSFYCLCLLYFFYKMGVSQLNNISAIYYLFYYVLQFFLQRC